MNKYFFAVPLVILFCFTGACNKGQPALGDAERAAIADSAKAVIRGIWDAGKALDANGVCKYFTRDPDGRFVEDGQVTPYEALLPGYVASYAALESLSVTPTALDAIVLARDSVALTAPCVFSFKTKAGAKFTGKTVLTLLVQQRNGVWQVVQSHVSHEDVAGIMAAFEQKPPQK
jgi:hypothetical protein